MLLVSMCRLEHHWEWQWERRCRCRCLLRTQSLRLGLPLVGFSRPAEAIDAEDADLLARLLVSLIRVTVVRDSVTALQVREPSYTEALPGWATRTCMMRCLL